MKYVLFYELSANGMELVRANYPAHKARVDDFHANKRILMVGTWANPAEGAMGIFPTREDADAFVAGDPFVLNGVVGKHTIREWNEALAP